MKNREGIKVKFQKDSLFFNQDFKQEVKLFSSSPYEERKGNPIYPCPKISSCYLLIGLLQLRELGYCCMSQFVRIFWSTYTLFFVYQRLCYCTTSFILFTVPTCSKLISQSTELNKAWASVDIRRGDTGTKSSSVTLHRELFSSSCLSFTLMYVYLLAIQTLYILDSSHTGNLFKYNGRNLQLLGNLS